MTISHKTRPNTEKEIYTILNPLFKQWFTQKFPSLALAQRYALLEIHSRNNILVSSPTGSGKTLTAFGAILNELIDSAQKGILQDKIYCVYVSPLRSLSRDIQKNLLEPLAEMEELHGSPLGIRVGVRTGDTTTKEKTAMSKTPPHIYITTPESLNIGLASPKFRLHLLGVEWFICDEIHSLAENKRGVDLSLGMERLAYLSPAMSRIGLSATVAPIERIAEFLVGSERDCLVVNVQFLKELDLQVICPVSNLIDTTHGVMHDAMYKTIHGLIAKHKTTLIFTNTRAATERVVHFLKEKFPHAYYDTPQTVGGSGRRIGAHHGSLSAEHRTALEENLRLGKLRVVVCLDGDTKVLTKDGMWVKIKEINKTSVQSIDAEFKLRGNRIKNIFRTNNTTKLLLLRTGFGKEIRCTPDHKFFTIGRNGNTEWKVARDLKPSDFVATIRKYYSNELTPNQIDKLCFEHYPDNYFVFLSKRMLSCIKEKLTSECVSVRSFQRRHLPKYKSLSHLSHILNGKQGMKIYDLRVLIEQLGLNADDVFASINAVSSSKYKMRKPVISKEMLRLIGFMMAEGYVSWRDTFFSNKDKDVLNYYRQLLTKLSGRPPGEKLSSSGTSVLVWSSLFVSQFLQNLGFAKGRKARTMSIPDFFSHLPSDWIWEFISGLMDGDGYLEVKDGRVYSAGYCTTSRRMADDFVLLLLSFGVMTSLNSKHCDEVQTLTNGRTIKKKGWFYTVSVIGGDNLRMFAKNLQPARKSLLRIRQTLVDSGYSNRDVIPNLGKKLRAIRNEVGISTYQMQKLSINPSKYEIGTRSIGRKQLKKLLKIYKSNDKYLSDLSNSDLFWEKVKDIQEITPPKYVYNLEVENDHNYIANGFLTKNCSTSLELGIDIGYIDLVILLGSPKSVARCLQRVGRSGHQLHSVTKGRIIVLDRDDLVECSVILKSAIEKRIDRIDIPTLALDVLAQHIIGMAVEQEWHEDTMFEVIRRSYCYGSLSKAVFYEILDFLAGRYADLEDRHVYARIYHEDKHIRRRGKLARMLYMTNLGTIADQSSVKVQCDGKIIGSVDEGFLEKLKKRDVFVLGGNTYEFRHARGMTATVDGSTSSLPTVPSWVSESLPLSFDLADAIGRFRRLMSEKLVSGESEGQILEWLHDYLYVDNNTAKSLYSYCKEQYDYVGALPSDTEIVVETYWDEKVHHYIFHTLYGRRVNDVLSRAIAFSASRIFHRDVDIGINDNGFFLSCDKKVDVLKALKHVKSSELASLMKIAIDKTEVLGRRFRHCAARAFMILRNYRGHIKRAGRQQISSMALLSAVRRIDENFSILREAKREVLEDQMDIEHAIEVLRRIESMKVSIKRISTTVPTPFAFTIILQGAIDVLRIEDRMEFLQQMHTLVRAKISLR